MPFKKYEGNDRYHVRFLRRNIKHPFIVTETIPKPSTKDEYYLSGFVITHSFKSVDKNNNMRLEHNPNPNDNKKSYLVRIYYQLLDSSFFSRPYEDWSISIDDEKKINILLFETISRYIRKAKIDFGRYEKDIYSIIFLIIVDPYITQNTLGDMIGKSVRTIQRRIRFSKIILRCGSRKNGFWRIGTSMMRLIEK